MPTENRSSNTEMVSVPRETIEQAEKLLQEDNRCTMAREFRTILAQPAAQHQGEPVAWRGINELGEIVTEWIDGSPPDRMVDLCGNPDSFAKIELAYTHADPGEAQRQRSRADTNALNHKHAKNALGDIKAFVGRLVAGSNGQASIATGYLADIADFIDRRTIGDPVHIGDANALRLDLQEARRNEFNASAEVERLREALAECKSACAEHEAQVAADFKHIDDLRAKLAKWGLLLGEIADHCNGCVMPTEQLLRDWGSSIDAALSASAESQP